MERRSRSRSRSRSPSSSSRPDRRTIERNRRNQMKALVSDLHSIVQRHNSKPSSSRINGTMSIPDQLEDATNYIKRLQIKVEKLKEKKQSMMTHVDPESRGGGGSMAPKVEIRRTGTGLEVLLITDSDSQQMFKETLKVLVEEEAEILSATYSCYGDAILHSIHCDVGDWEFTPFTCDRISERLRQMVSLQK